LSVCYTTSSTHRIVRITIGSGDTLSSIGEYSIRTGCSDGVGVRTMSISCSSSLGESLGLGMIQSSDGVSALGGWRTIKVGLRR